MNKTYKITKQKSTGLMVVTSELAKGNKKSLTGAVAAVLATTLLLNSVSSFAANIIVNVDESTPPITTQVVIPDNDTQTYNFTVPGLTLTFKDINGSAIQFGAGSVLDFTGNTSTATVIFSGNKTTGDGGGIYSVSYSDSDSPSSVTLGNYATFSGNTASGSGGGIFSMHSPDFPSVTLGNHALFKNNRVNGNSSSGGAIYLNGKLNIAGHSYFTDNSASSDGGAIGAGYGSIALNADVGAIAFDGNYDNVSVSNPAGNRNSISLLENAQLNLQGNHNIYFNDPISSPDSKNSLVKSGTGMVQFLGENRLNTAGISGGTFSVDIQAGTFRLGADADKLVTDSASAIFDASGSGKFNVEAGATLAGSGKIIAGSGGFTISGIISPDGYRYIISDDDYNFTIHEFTENLTPEGNAFGTLTLEGDVQLNGATLNVGLNGAQSSKIVINGNVTSSKQSTVALANGAQDGDTYDLLTANNLVDANGFAIDISSGIGQSGYAYARGSKFDVINNDTLQVTIKTTDNLTLNWTGSEDTTWENTSASSGNWSNNPDGTAAETHFLNNDTVNFSDNAGGNITVDSGNVSIGGMTVSGTGDWTFSSGSINGTGGITKTGNGTLTLANANGYSGGTTINGGTLIASSDTVLGSGGVTTGDNGTLKINYTGFNKTLSGTGTLAVEMADATDAFDFTDSSKISGFEGTVDLQKGKIDIDEVNSVALKNSTLKLNSTSEATITHDKVSIGGLTTNGSSLKITADNETITVKKLDTSGGGAIKIDFGQTINRDIDEKNNNWYSYNSSDNAKQYKIVNATESVTDGQLAVKDLSGSSLEDNKQTVTLDAGAGTATFNDVATAVQKGDEKGLYLGYTLTELNAATGKNITLDSTTAGDDVSLTAKLSGDGGFIFSGNKTATITGATNDYQGATKIDNTNIIMGSNNAFGATSSLNLTGNANIDMNDKSQTVQKLVSIDTTSKIILGELTVNQNTDSSYNGTLAGSKLIKTGTGALTLTNTNTYTDGTTISAGKIIATHQSALGTGDVAVDTNATLGLDFASDSEFINKITGAGGLEKSGSGKLTLSNADNDYTGGTTINNGTLLVTNQLALGSGDITNNSQLELAFAGEFTKTIAGTGGLTKLGGDKLILNSINNYAGTTDVKEGILIVGGSSANKNAQITGNVDVQSGATLGGHGLITGHVQVNGGATLSPGNSIGFITVGSITFDKGSFYEFEVNPDGSADKIESTGAVIINGGTISVLAGAGSWAASSDYKIIETTGSLTGHFDNINTNLAFLNSALSYGSDYVSLKLTRNQTLFTDVAKTHNQWVTAYAIDGLSNTHAISTALTGLSAEQARAGFDNLSGEIHASTKSAILSNRYARDSINRHLTNLDFDSEKELWVNIWAHDGHLKSDGNAAKLDNKGWGVIVGADAYKEGNTAAGLALSYEQINTKAKNNRRSDADVELVHFFAYGRTKLSEIDLKGAIGYSRLSIDSTRSISVGNLQSHNKADYDGGLIQAYLEGSHTFELSSTTNVTPFLNLAYQRINTDGFNENGKAATLHGSSSHDDIFTSTLGARGNWQITTQASLYGELGWQHTFGDVAPTSTLSFDRINKYNIKGVEVDRNSALIGIGGNYKLQPNMTISTGYQASLGDQNRDNALNVKFEYQF